jgi:outer membrane receptor protein involved in Fe transport
MRRILLLFTFSLVAFAGALAQVTTSSLNGVVRDANGQALPGATVRATHEPSGTLYGTTTNVEGRFFLPNVRVGGPYTVVVSYVGYQEQKYSGINLKLGEPFTLNAALQESQTELTEIVVTSERTIDVDKVGAATNLNSRQFATMPTISRSLTDFTRFTPQANGNSFAGRDGRFNNIQVDGANLNNNFGLSNDPLPGGGNSPISLDSYEEVSVNIAPFDVRQSGFTGAGINAVTKSGTNTFKGTAYTFWRNQNYLGTNVGSNDISNQIVDSKNNIYGFSLGGPIIKNKLFFFVNTELEKGNRPGIAFSPDGGSGNGVVSSTPVDSLQKFSNHLRDTYGYETGPFDNFPNFGSENRKLLVKIDYNISQDHKLTFKYSSFNSTNDQQLNGTSVPNGGGFNVTGQANALSRLTVNRFSNQSMSFANSNYGFEDKVNTGTLELNSNFGSKISNQFLATITKVETVRTFGGGIFPTIDIFDGVTGNNYMTAGMDPFTNNNQVINDVLTFTNNFTYYANKHTITAGLTYEYQRVGNMFMAASNSHYIYNSLDDFINDRAPVYFAYTYSLTDEPAVFSADLKIGQFGIYAQDEFNPSDRLKLTIGIRADKPIYLEDPLENPAASALTFYDEDGNTTNYSTGVWPKGKILLSPRVGFKYEASEDRSLVLRGGTGLFTGRIPFVWLTNMPTNSGMYQFGARLRNSNAGEAADLANITFSPNPDEYASLFPTTAGGSAPGNLVFMSEDFNFPQIFRTNIAADKKLGNGLTVSAELLFSKDINAVRMYNANFKPNTNGTVVEGGLSRPRYLSSADRNENSNISNAIVLANTNKGYSTALTFQVTKTFDKGLYGSLAYTFTKAEEVTANPGSQAASVWNGNPNVGTSNAIELASSQYAVPHRVVGNVSYRYEYAKYFASTLSLFYEGSQSGNFSYVVNGDLNGDGNGSTDLMYIPRDASEMNFEEYTATVGGNPVTFTVADQEAAFEEFIENSKYLSKHRGEFAERNAALLPWYNRWDLRFLQDIFIETGKNNMRHTLQLSVDILNVANFVNKNWGIQQIRRTNNPLVYRSVDGNNAPLYRYQQIGGELVTEPFQDLISPASTWSMQIGLRYIF